MKTVAPARTWRNVRKALEAEGWEVTYERMWRVRIRRGTHIEDGLAASLDEAFAEVREQAGLDNCEGCP